MADNDGQMHSGQMHPHLRPRYTAAIRFFYANFAVNAFSSLLTLSLMFYMWKRGRMKFNLFTKCVLQMTLFQLLYEIFDPLRFEVAHSGGYASGESSTLRVLTIGSLFLGGVGSSAWSLIMLLGALFTVLKHRQPSTHEQIYAFVVVNSLLLGFAIAGMNATYDAYTDLTNYHELWIFWKLYDYIRVSLLGFSGIALSILYYMMIKTSKKGERQRSPLYHLLRKIVPYTLFLFVSRFGATSYRQIYHESPSSYPEDAGDSQTFWLYLDFVLTPLVGTAFLITFINVTAGAKRSLMEMLGLECLCTLPPAPAAWDTKDGNTDNKSALYGPNHRPSAYISREERPNPFIASDDGPHPALGDSHSATHTPAHEHHGTPTLEEDYYRMSLMNEDDLAVAVSNYASRSLSRNEVRMSQVEL